MKSKYKYFDGIFKSQKFRFISLLIALAIVAAIAVLGYTYEIGGEYGYGPQYVGYDYHTSALDGYYVGGAYDYDDSPTYIGGYMIALGDRDVYLGDFEIYDYENNLMALNGAIYYVCLETMSGSLIQPLMNITVIFNPNGGNTIPGEESRDTSTGDATGGTIGPLNMPANPTHDLARMIRGWNTQADGRGQPFDGNTHVCAINGPFEVFMIWYVTVSFNLNGSPLAVGTDQNNPNHFVDRTHIPEGWSINEVPGRTFPRELTLPTDRTGYTFHGWWDTTALMGGQRFFGDTPIYDTKMLSARWTPPNNPVVTFHAEGGTIPPEHSNEREAYPGLSINDSSRTPDPGGLPRINVGVRWARTGPYVTPPAPGQYLEGWWTSPGGWDGSGDRFASPGFQWPPTAGVTDYYMYDRGNVIPVPRDWANTPITTSMDVFAHWVYRVKFMPNGGGIHLQNQPLYFYPIPAHGIDGGTRSAPTFSYVLYRDIPITGSGNTYTIENSGIQRSTLDFIHPTDPLLNRVADQPVDRRTLPVGIDPNPDNVDLSRAGHSFNGWWDRPIPAYWVPPMGWSPPPSFPLPSGWVPGQQVPINPALPGGVDGTPWAGAQQFFVDTPVTGSRTVYAHWTRNDNVVITFDPQGGWWYRIENIHWGAWNHPPIGTQDYHYVDIPGPGASGIAVYGGNILSTPGFGSPNHRVMPTFPQRDGYVFVGWYSHPQYRYLPDPADPTPENPSLPLVRVDTPLSDFNYFLSRTAGNQFYRRINFTVTSVVAQDITVYAHWKPYITLLLNPMGGVFQGPTLTMPTGRPNFRPVAIGMARNVTYANPQQAATPAGLGGGVQIIYTPYTLGRLQAVGWDHTATHGAPYYLQIISSPFQFYMDRPGYIPMLTQWQWSSVAERNNWLIRPTPGITIPSGFNHPSNNAAPAPWNTPNNFPLGYGPRSPHPAGPGAGGPPLITTGTGSTMWNLSPDGSSGVFLSTGGITTNEMATHAVNGVVEFYAQWAAPVTFVPNLDGFGSAYGAATTPVNRVINVAVGRSFEGEFRRDINFHTPPIFNRPPIGPYIGLAPTGGVGTRRPFVGVAPLWDTGNPAWIAAIPPPPPVATPAPISWDWTLEFPNPNPERPRTPGAPATATDGNWDAIFNINHNGVPIRNFFTGWNTCPNGTGDSYNQYDRIYTATRLYAQWATNTLNFHGNHAEPTPSPNQYGPAAVNWPTGWPAANVQGYRVVAFTPGLPMPWPAGPPPGGMPSDASGAMDFVGWNSQRDGLGMWLPMTGNIPFTSGTFYAIWGAVVTFVTEEGTLGPNTTTNANLNSPVAPANLASISTPVRTGWNFDRFSFRVPQSDGSLAQVTPIAPAHRPAIPGSPIITGPTTAYAHWDGRFVFNLSGGHINNNTANVTSFVPEFYSTTQALASTTLSVFPGGQSGRPVTPTIAERAVLPVNPAHADPSMVFMGWRITYPATLASNAILTRTQVSNIVMNGYVNPDDDDCEDRNAITGLINLEAVWHERVVFTKTGELFYANPIQVQPRNGATFEIRRYDPATSEWNLVSGLTLSTSGAEAPAIGTNNGTEPFATLVPASTGRVVASRPLTPAGQYRLIETLPPPGYMREGGFWNIHTTVLSNGEVRIVGFTAVDHNLFFRDLDEPIAIGDPEGDVEIITLPYDGWHVGNRRPRLMFEKLDREGEPLNGAIFVVERRERLSASDPWPNWPPIVAPPSNDPSLYWAQPSGTAMPAFPATTPMPSFPSTNPVLGSFDGLVVISRPFTPNVNLLSAAPSTTVQYRLREVYATDGYIIPLGYWTITTNHYGEAEFILPSTSAAPDNLVPPFVPAGLSAVNPAYPWRRTPRSIQNIPVRYWPFLKTDAQLITNAQHSYLEGAVFMLFVWDDPTSLPANDRMVTPAEMFGSGGQWRFVTERISNPGTPTTRDPMWFPMMPGRIYQLVEVIAPVGHQLPWGQWRLTVTGATDLLTITGTGLNYSQIIGWGTPEIRRILTGIPCANIHIDAGYHCCDDTNCTDLLNMHVFHIPNLTDFYLPLTGGTGISVAIAAIGTALTGVSIVILLYKFKAGKAKQS